jgi:chemotaxis protein CheC
VYPIESIAQVMADLVQGEVATVHQTFRGPVAGDALLLLNQERALALTGLLIPDEVPPTRLDASAREVLTEVGNILLNACLGSLSNLLGLHITFSVPSVHLEALVLLMDSLLVAEQTVRYALVVRTNFRQRDNAVTGYVLLILSVSSLDRLLQAIDTLS